MVKAGEARIVRHETGRPDPGFSWSVGHSSIDESPGVASAFGQEVREGIQVVVRRDGDGQQEGEKRERRRAAGAASEPARQPQGLQLVTLHCCRHWLH